MPNPIPPMSEATRKRITIPAKPADPDAWVQGTPAAAPKPAEKLARLSVDIPVEVRTQLKIQAAMEGRTILELVQGLIVDYLTAKGRLS